MAIIHGFSVLVSVSLFFNFLFELTSLAPETRLKIFRVELTKVFMTSVMFYMISLIFTSWMDSMAYSIKVTLSWKESKVKHQRNQYENKINMYLR